MPVLMLLGGCGDQGDDSEGLGPVLHRNQNVNSWVITGLNAQGKGPRVKKKNHPLN